MSREKSAHHMVVQRMNSGRREKRPSIEGYIAGTLQAYGIRKGILGQVWARIAGMPGVRFLAIEDSNTGRDLRIRIIIHVFSDMRSFLGRRIMASGLPDPKMLQNLLDNRLVRDDADHPHFALAFGAYQRVYFVYLLYQPSPISAKFLCRQV